MPQKTVVIAPDSFKGSLDAVGVARAIGDGWASVRPGDDIRLVPLADGGEGTMDAIEAAVPGAVRRDAGEVEGPDGRPLRGEWLELPDGTAVVELAQMSGLPQMAELDALGANTYGLGQVIRAALEAGAPRLVIGLGGSASTDAASAALAALGLTTAPPTDSRHLRRGGAGLTAIRALDGAELLPAPPGGVVLLTDVDAPLLGPRGAAAVFGPQKGASADDVATLDAALAHFAELLGGDPDLPGAGAA
ncbi:MAG: glycerate kinase, partial [Microbacteriaceae bacterium]|nr:glycerate kinase [Microbacteriaceae bacterium]